MPLYTLRNKTTGETVKVTDPGRALIDGKWSHIGRFKGPMLRNLAARAPYFHNGFAEDLDAVVDFYDTGFHIGFTKQEQAPTSSPSSARCKVCHSFGRSRVRPALVVSETGWLGAEVLLYVISSAVGARQEDEGMMRWMHPPEIDRASERDDFDPAVEGARYRLSRDASLATWEQVCAEATDGHGRLDADQARRRFHDLAAHIQARGGRLGPDVGRLTRVQTETPGAVRAAWGVDDSSRAPGRTSLVTAEIQSSRSAQPHAGVLQARAREGLVDEDPGELRRLARRAVAGSGARLPFFDLLQRAFGRHDLSSIEATTGGDAATAARAMGAEAFAFGERVVFADAPGLHTAAHEAAHVIQQRGGVDLDGGVGREGDRHERHADAVADRVVRGESAADLLDAVAPVRGDASRAGGDGGGRAGLQLRRIPPNVAALLRAIGSTTANGANFDANADGVERLIALATSELTPAERTTVLHDRLGGVTQAAYDALPRRERLIRHANAIRTLVRTEPLELGDPAQINVSPTDPTQVANLATVVHNADTEFARIAAGTANTDVDSVFGAANRATALARYAAARTRMNNRHTAHAIVTDRSGYNEQVGLGGLTNADRISIEAAVIDNPALASSITTLMHESMHAGNPGVVGDNGGYQDAAFVIAAPLVKLANAAHYEVPIWRHLAPASSNAFPNPHPPPAFREFVPPGVTPTGGGAPQPPPTVSQQAAIDASHHIQMAWTMGLNLHEVYQRLLTTRPRGRPRSPSSPAWRSTRPCHTGPRSAS